MFIFVVILREVKLTFLTWIFKYWNIFIVNIQAMQIYRLKLKYLILASPSTFPSTKIFYVSFQSFSYIFIFTTY